MKTGMALVLLLAFSLSDAEGHGKHPRAFEAFHGPLGHHGEWVYYDHDLYVWRPNQVTVGWQPYTEGRWVWTVDGWYWESDEPWGWATYHYGRWAYDDYLGWVWIPDLEWAPAWVEWRTGPACLGWAPMGPYSLIHLSFGPRWNYRVVPVSQWVFVDYKDITRHKVHKYVHSSRDKKKYYEQTKEIPVGERRTFGPDRGEVERRGKIRVTETRVARETIETKRTGSDRVAPQPGTVGQERGRTQTQPTPRVDDPRRVSAGRTATEPRKVEQDRNRVQAPAIPRSDTGRIQGRTTAEERIVDRSNDCVQAPSNARVDNSRRASSDRVPENSNGDKTTREARVAPRVQPQE